ncbi:MAG: glycerol-3-phosphate acyltransferase [Candidatus Kapaibacterium sp.]
METFLFALCGYLIGSVPVAYLLARKRNGIDLRKEGSGNVGARNAYEVTGNKGLGFTVLLFDMLKGILPLIIVAGSGYCKMLPVVAVTIVLGHCYPVWLKFHGGRGLATGAAIAALIAPDSIACWVVVYLLSGFIRKQVHLQTLIATLICLIFTFVGYDSVHFFNIRFICQGDKYLFQYSIVGILCIILSRHVQPVYELLIKKNA